jgi:hypothetical protein
LDAVTSSFGSDTGLLGIIFFLSMAEIRRLGNNNTSVHSFFDYKIEHFSSTGGWQIHSVTWVLSKTP